MKRVFALTIVIMLLLNNSVFANEYTDEYYKNVDCESIKSSSSGGEWLILAMARSGIKMDFNEYYENLCGTLKAENGDIDRKYTTYSRIIIVLTAIGKNPYNVSGYNLVEKIADYDKVTAQGLNSVIYAIIATKCGGYKNAECENYLSLLLSKQNSDGSFSLSGRGDVDVTAMALQALSFYKYRSNVERAVERAVEWLKGKNSENLEGYAQMLTAYTALGNYINKSEIERVYNNIMEYTADRGFSHIKGEEFNQMATEQAAYAIAAYERYCRGENSLYDINNNKIIYMRQVK